MGSSSPKQGKKAKKGKASEEWMEECLQNSDTVQDRLVKESIKPDQKDESHSEKLKAEVEEIEKKLKS
ncbi:hypothetical protein CTRI78_v008683 [Colletotrichum trifolii]|uniref:Uncharacterized protein n=1 Tax=Colletotrichum trifolii TaxID=5466 RepID=A0A4R8QSZ1_COLTR|nr:hypothetical protein CTRI78_v008683 [Colletotrichum trifolii]